MIKINKQVTNPTFESLTKENKRNTTTGIQNNSTVETSYENNAANLAITNSNKAMVKTSFKPATTAEELANQINNTKWYQDGEKESPKFFQMYLKEKENIINFSKFWHELDNLSPTLQKK